MLSGFQKVFCFTLLQKIKSTGWRAVTLILTLLCLLLPPIIMGVVESLSSGIAEAEVPVQTVYVVDETGEKSLNFLPLKLMSAAMDYPEYTGLSYHTADTAEAALQSAADTPDALVLVLTKEAEQYQASLILPESSSLTDSAMYQYETYLNQVFPYIILMKSDIPLETLLQQVTSENAAAEDVEDAESDPVDSLDTIVREILGYLLPFVNIMLLYFLVLFYGQGTANSVILEKNSKLMDTFLLSVKPEAMILGKVFAQTACCVIQVSLWIGGLAAGFFCGIQLVTYMNPETEMPLIQAIHSLSFFADAFTLTNILFFLLFLLGGQLLYLALASIGGAIAGKQEDLNTTNALFTITLVVSFLITLYSGGIDGISQSSILDWIPFTSILIAPSHLILGEITIWAALGSLAILLAADLLLILMAGRIYKAMALYKGNLPKAKQLVAILFSKS